MKKRLLTLILAVAMLSTSVTGYAVGETGLGNFVKKNYYVAGQFSDVPSGAWYAETVGYAFELDLVKGTSNTTYTPDGNIKIAEALALASRLHSIYYTGTCSFVQGDPWYQVYVDYAVNNGIIYAGQFSDYTTVATRAQFATILEAAFPNSALQAINNVPDIPDVKQSASFANAVYKLYNAGVLTGSDDLGTFFPGQPIKRSEVATIIARMANPSMRKSLSFGEEYSRISVNTNNLTINKETIVYITENYEETITAIWECDSDVIKLTWGQFGDENDNKSTAPLTITPLKDGEATIRIYIKQYPDEYVTIKVTVQGLNTPRISVNTSNLVINQETKIYVTESFDEPITIVAERDSGVVKIAWGDFEDVTEKVSRIPLTITPLQTGEDTIKIYTKQFPEEYVTIKVKVQGMSSEDEGIGVYDYLVRFAKQHGTYANNMYEYIYYVNSTTNYTHTCSLIYDGKEEEVIIGFEINKDSAKDTTLLFIKPGLNTPYELGYMHRGSSTGIDLTATANIYPRIFSAQNGINFYLKSDNSTAMNSIWENAESLAARMLEISLVKLEEKVLIPGGFELGDLGFTI